MKLYYSKGACSLAPRIIINELGLSCEYESVDIKSKNKRTETGEDFLKINPKGSVPVLITDEGETLTENGVILQYLANLGHAKQLFPQENTLRHYRVLEWLNFVATDMHKGVGILFNNAIPQDIKDQVLIPIIKNKLHYLNEHLQKNEYLLGDEFMLPDAYLFVITNWLYFFKFDVSEWPNLQRYITNLRKRPSIQQSLKHEGLLITAKDSA